MKKARPAVRSHSEMSEEEAKAAQDLLEQAKNQKATPAEDHKKIERLKEGIQFLSGSDEEQPKPEPQEEPQEDDLDEDHEEDGENTIWYRGTPMDNPKIRKEIESRCDPIDLSDILSGRIKQKVPIIPNILEVVFRTITDKENMFLFDLLEKLAQDHTDEYIRNLVARYRLALVVESINGQDLPDLRKEGTGFSEKDMNERVTVIENQMEEIVDAIAVNHVWFKDRVAKAMRNPDTLGNG